MSKGTSGPLGRAHVLDLGAHSGKMAGAGGFDFRKDQGKLKRALQARAGTDGLDNVVFHPPVPKPKLAGLMAEADIGMQILANVPAFYYGTSPNKFFDYIASGLPVLNNYPGWLASMIEESGCGYVVPPESPAAFADALIDAADHREKLLAMGERARQLAVGRFDRSQLAGQFVAELDMACVKRQIKPTQ